MDPVSEAAIDNWFSFHPATPETGPRHDEVRTLLRTTAQQLSAMLPSGPERTTAINKLREAMTWANSAIACAPKP